MSEPTNKELLVHLTYIRDSVDNLRTMAETAAGRLIDHGERITILEERIPEKKSGAWRTIGAFVGGLLSGIIGGKVG